MEPKAKMRAVPCVGAMTTHLADGSHVIMPGRLSLGFSSATLRLMPLQPLGVYRDKSSGPFNMWHAACC